MARHINVDSLAFVSLDGLYKACGLKGRNAEKIRGIATLFHRRLSHCPDGPKRRPGTRRSPADGTGIAPCPTNRHVSKGESPQSPAPRAASAGGRQTLRPGGRPCRRACPNARGVGGPRRRNQGFRGKRRHLDPLRPDRFRSDRPFGGVVVSTLRQTSIFWWAMPVVGGFAPMGHLDPKTWDRVIGVNLTANWRLLRTVDPLLRQSDAGRSSW